MGNRRTHQPILRRTTGLGLVLVWSLSAGAPGPAFAWDTEEHIRFGEHIADPFEKQLLHGELPVLTSELTEERPGPSRFGHWVSAPDFGRSLKLFLDLEAVTGDLACAVLWNDRGVEFGGETYDDQMFIDDPDEGGEPTPISLLEHRAHLDCTSLQAVNNNHFGDFARKQFLYYHAQALEAAKRYRATRNETCHELAYTLEAWGQHHLTDSTAAGHAWNPPGSYDDDGLVFTGKFINLVTGLPIRMRIHHHLNRTGGQMAGELFEDGMFWGDHSERNTPNGQKVTELVGNPQRELTMRLARMALGDVVAAAECGALPQVGALFDGEREGDPRRIFVSNRTMCNVMWRFVPDFLQKLLFQHPALDQLVGDCKDNGNYQGDDPAGDIFASCYFKDVFTNTDKNSCAVDDTLDPRGLIDLEELGCSDQAPDMGETIPALAAGHLDSCGSALCEVPVGIDGFCPGGFDRSGICCYEPAAHKDGSGKVEILAQGSTFAKALAGGLFGLTTPTTVLGAASSFLWFEDDRISPSQEDSAWKTITTSQSFTLEPTQNNITLCGETASASIHETRVRMPQVSGLEGKELVLEVLAMDEALKIQVDGRLIGYFSNDESGPALSAPLRIPILTTASSTEDDEHTLRITHLNGCEDARTLKLKVTLDSDEKNDDLGGGGMSGCSSSGSGRPAGLLWFLLVIAGAALCREARRRD